MSGVSIRLLPCVAAFLALPGCRSGKKPAPKPVLALTYALDH